MISALLLAGCGAQGARSDLRPAGATSKAATGAAIVPWLPLPPTRPSIPFTVTPAHPNPLRAERARHCRGSDLHLRWPGAGAALGTMIDNVEIDLARGHSACAVDGRPSLAARTVEGTILHGVAGTWGTPWRAPVLLTRRHHALVRLTWPSACFALGGSGSITLGYGGQTWSSAVPELSDDCHFAPNRPLTAIEETRIAPPHYRPPHRVTAYSTLRARVPAHLTEHYEQPLDFVVTLVARHDVVLDPCPDYRVGDGSVPQRRYRLNCAAVPWRDGQGRPYLPAGRPVRFAMHVGGVAGKAAKFWWGIVAPGRPPFHVGLVKVR